MRPAIKSVLIALLVLVTLGVLAAGTALLYVRSTGLSALEQPGTVETFVARAVRGMVIAAHAHKDRNPVERAPEVIADGRAHFADHCASCHANDGSGDTTIGRGLFPKAPDMRSADTQQLSDGELFYIIEHGIRFTGMPGWSTGTPEGEEASWRLVHFIRHLPELSEPELAEMESLNPASPDEIRQRLEEERFLQGIEGGGEPPPPSAPSSPHKHPGGQP